MVKQNYIDVRGCAFIKVKYSARERPNNLFQTWSGKINISISMVGVYIGFTK